LWPPPLTNSDFPFFFSLEFHTNRAPSWPSNRQNFLIWRGRTLPIYSEFAKKARCGIPSRVVTCLADSSRNSANYFGPPTSLPTDILSPFENTIDHPPRPQKQTLFSSKRRGAAIDRFVVMLQFLKSLSFPGGASLLLSVSIFLCYATKLRGR